MSSLPPNQPQTDRVLHDLLVSIRQWLREEEVLVSIGAAAERALFEELPAWQSSASSAVLHD